MRLRNMIHSPMPGTSSPSQTPAGMAYRPQWMNIPKRASRHQVNPGWSTTGAALRPRMRSRQLIISAMSG